MRYERKWGLGFTLRLSVQTTGVLSWGSSFVMLSGQLDM